MLLSLLSIFSSLLQLIKNFTDTTKQTILIEVFCYDHGYTRCEGVVTRKGSVENFILIIFSVCNSYNRQN